MPRPTVRASRSIGRTDGDRVFRAAARHSRFVRFLRIAIPVSIVIIAGLVVAAAFFNPFRLIAHFPIDPGKVSLSGTKIVMELPRVNGFTSDARPYEMTARVAAQDITKPEVLELTDVSARSDLKDGQHVNLTAINGVYNTKSEILKLRDHVVMNSSNGYEGHFSEATVNVTTGYIVSDSPVQVKLPDGMLDANRLEVLEGGDLLRFGGGVEMTLNPPEPAPETPTTAAVPRGANRR